MSMILKNRKKEYLWEVYNINSRIIPEVITKKFNNKKVGRTNTKFINTPSLPLSNMKEIDAPLSKILSDRVSKLNNGNKRKIDFDCLQNLLLNSYSNTGDRRTAASAGKLYPIDIYFNYSNLGCNKKSQFNSGLYYYDVDNKIICKVNNDQKRNIASSCVQSDILSESIIQFFLVARFEQTIKKYSERGYRYALIEAGHICQNFHLVSTALQLGFIPIGGYYENRCNDILKLDGLTESVVYMFAIN